MYNLYFIILYREMANIVESAWLNRAHYEGAMDRFQVFKATGKTFQVRLSLVTSLVWLSQNHHGPTDSIEPGITGHHDRQLKTVTYLCLYSGPS